MKIIDLYEKNYPLFMAVSFSVADCHCGRAITEKEYERYSHIAEVNKSRIEIAKKMIEENPKYNELDDYDKVNIATWIVEYLQELEGNDTDLAKEPLSDKTIRFLI